MKTLYIDINNKPIENTDEVMCLSDNGSLQNDFFYELGCSLLSKSGVNVPKAQLISEFKTSGNDEAYNKIVSQWDSLKTIIFGEEIEGTFEVHLPKEYISWLSTNQNQEYRALCTNKGYDVTKELVITIDVEDFYDEYIDEDFRRSVVKVLKENTDIEQIVFNDDAVTRKSLIVKRIRKEFENISFNAYERWIKNSPFNDDSNKNENMNKPPLTSVLFYISNKSGQAQIIDNNKQIIMEGARDSLCVVAPNMVFCKNKLFKVERGNTVIELNIPGCEELKDCIPILNEYVLLHSNKGYGVIDLDGQIMIPFGEYEEISFNPFASKSTVAVKKDGLYGFYSLNERKFVEKFYYTHIEYSSYGDLILVAEDKFDEDEPSWGVYCVDNNRIVVPCEYEDIEIFDNSFRVTKDFEKYGIYSQWDDCEILPLEYDDIEEIDSNSSERIKDISFYKCKQDDNWYVVSSDNEIILSLENEYDDVTCHANTIDVNYETVYIIDDRFDDCLKLDNGLVQAEKNEYDSEGNKRYFLLVDDGSPEGEVIVDSYCDTIEGSGIFAYRHYNSFENTDVYDEKGILIASKKCDDFYVMSDEYFVLQVKSNYEVYDKHGKLLCILREKPQFIKDKKIYVLSKDGQFGYYAQGKSYTSLGTIPSANSIEDINSSCVLITNEQNQKGLYNIVSKKITIQYSSLIRSIKPIQPAFGLGNVYTEQIKKANENYVEVVPNDYSNGSNVYNIDGTQIIDSVFGAKVFTKKQRYV